MGTGRNDLLYFMIYIFGIVHMCGRICRAIPRHREYVHAFHVFDLVQFFTVYA